MLYDMHIHTDASGDGFASAQVMADAALSMGLSGIAVTDHFEIFKPDRELMDVNYPGISFESASAAKELFAGRLEVLAGIELGQGQMAASEAKRVADMYDYDYILGSNHVDARGEDFFLIKCEREPDIGALLEGYLRVTTDMTERIDFNCLAHLSFPLRYIKYIGGYDYSLESYPEALDRLLRRLIEKGAALEVNTSGFAGETPYLMPEINILKRYYALGGRRIALGSDAHRPERIARGFKKAVRALISLGFDGFCVYRKRREVFVRF